MASTLASQLQALAVAGGGATSSKPSARPSLLFHPSQAADIDLQTIFTLSETGLDDLITMDGRFKAFKKTLFSIESSQIDRELQAKEYNAKLNKSITTFLRLLSGYVMLTSAHQTLEYLIRRYKIQVYNVEDVVLCVLPYHETSLFVRVVQLLQIKNTRWQFLEAVQSSGAAPPRAVLVQRCTHDMALVESVCELAMAVSGIAAKSKTTITFTSVVLIETLAEVPIVSTDLVNRILPFILRSFNNGIAEEYRVGALMIIGSLANRSSLAPSLVETLFDNISRAFQRGSESEGHSVLQLHIMVLIQLVQTQHIQPFPSKSFKTLVKVRDFIPILFELVKRFDTQKFLTILVQVLVEHVVVDEHYEYSLLDVIKSLPVGDQVVSSVLRLLEISFGEGGEKETQADSSKSRDIVKKVLLAFEKRFPAELDKAISLYFQKSKVDEGKKTEDPVFSFLSDVFHGSLRIPLEESHMSLYLSLDHPQASIREIAIQQLSQLAATQEPIEGAEIYAVLREAYLRRLSDDDYNVVCAVLLVDNLVEVTPAERLFPALASIISRCNAEYVAGERLLKRDVKIISKLVVELLATKFLAQYPGYLERVAVLFFEHLLQRPLTWRLNRLMLRVAGTIPFPLFAEVLCIYEETPLGADGEGAKSKDKRRVWQIGVNTKIIKSLAVKFLDDSTALVPLLLNPSLSDNLKLLVVLVLLECLKKHSEAMSTKLIDASLQWLRDEWAVEGSGKSLPAELETIDYTKWDNLNATPPELYHQLEIKSKTVYSELLLRAFYGLVKCVPYTNTVKLENQSDGGQDPLNELFVLFAGSSPVKVFTPHVDLLLSRLPAADILPFLSKFFITEGSAVPAFVQVHSLNVLASQLVTIVELNSEAVDHNVFKHLQSALPPLLVALGSPLKAVRRSAIQCVEDLSRAWEKHSSGKEVTKDLDAPLLNPRSFGKILEIVTGAKAALISNGTYLEELWKENYGIMQESADEAMTSDADEHRSIITFFVDQALHLTVYGQRVVFKVLQGMAHCSALIHATQERLTGLVERRTMAHLLGSSADGPYERLTQAEVQLLEVLLQMYTPSLAAEASQGLGGKGEEILSSFFHSLTVEGGSLVDPAVLQPCCAALKCLTPEFYSALGVSGQDIVFQSLISLSAVNSEIIRSPAHASLRTLQISASTVARHLEHVREVGLKAVTNERKTKRRKAIGDDKISLRNRWPVKGTLLTSTSSILEFLVWKSDMERREALLAPLFKLLKAIIGGVWPQVGIDEGVVMEANAAKGDLSQAAVLLNAQHLIFMILEGIVRSLSEEVTEQKNLINDLGVDVDTVVIAVNKAEDGTTRNHALAVLTSLARLIPDAVLKHLIDILSVVGESTLTQDDSHSHRVVYQMLTAVVPAWLAVEKDPTVLLEVFVSALPRMPSHRRMATITNLLRVTSEEVGLHVFVFLLLQKARDSVRIDDSEPEGMLENGEPKDSSEPLDSVVLDFAATLFRQYSPGIKLPAMVRLLDISRVESTVSPDEWSRRQAWALQQLATQFVANQLQGSEFRVGGQLAASSETLQKSSVALMEQVLLQLQTISRSDSLPAKLKNGAQEAAVSILDGLTLVIASTEYIRGMSSLMKHSDTNIRRKVLRMYSSKIKEPYRPILVGQTKKKRENVAPVDDEHLPEEELELRVGIVNDITNLLAGNSEEQSVSTKLAAIDALNVSAQRFAEKAPNVFVSSLAALVSNLQLKNRALGAAAVRCMATILAKLGPLALPALPDTVSALFEIAEQAMAAKPGVGDGDTAPDGNDSVEQQSELIVALLEALEAMLDKLGAFLTPYLEKIVGLVILRPQLLLNTHSEIHRRATTLRALLPTKVPARLLLDPLLNTYDSAIEAGEDSTCALFDMLAAITAKADRASVATYRGRIFEFCLTAFDLRGRGLSTLQSVSKVETAVVNAVVLLVMKLSETTFKPLFVKILEWAESETETKDGSFVSQNVDRNIAFYKLVNQLTAKLRSVFVPYLQYLINGCVHHLTGGLGLTETEMLKPKKKKKKHSVNEEQKATLSPSEWHLRQLILSSLHQCFLYDTIGFLDAPKFQLLLAPIVSQLVVEAPTEVPMLKQGEASDIPSLQEMDDTLVSCLGQMALTAGTDLLWKPLNHEVLMCTRVENVRTRLLGLRVVKFLAEHLKEEYLVLLPETIPFLAELLEDTELTVVAKTQEVVKFLEDLSGEDLSQYF
ncbi:unnamed protein product [Calypogeia fissa]